MDRVAEWADDLPLALAIFADVEGEFVIVEGGYGVSQLDSWSKRNFLAAVALPGVDHNVGHGLDLLLFALAMGFHFAAIGAVLALAAFDLRSEPGLAKKAALTRGHGVGVIDDRGSQGDQGTVARVASLGGVFGHWFSD